LIECLSSARLVSTHRPRARGRREKRNREQEETRKEEEEERKGVADEGKQAREGQGKGVIKRRKRKVGERGTRGGMGKKESGEMP